MNCKGIPGNIGLVRSHITIYEHNPFWARPYQHTSFPFTALAGAEITKDPYHRSTEIPNEEDTDDKGNVVFQFQDAFLKPKNIKFSNFVATIQYIETPRGKDATIKAPDQVIDIVEGMQHSSDVLTQLPGDDPDSVYNKSDYMFPNRGKYSFPHLLFLYQGSDIYETDVISPSNYAAAISETAEEGTTVDILREEARQKLSSQQGTALWDMEVETNSQDSFPVVYPIMVGRPTCETCGSIHWTLQKFTPMYQGQDFFVRFNKIDVVTEEYEMGPDPHQELKDNPMKSGSEGTPFFPFFEPAYTGYYRLPSNSSLYPFFENGVSNAPFFSPAEKQEEVDAHTRKTFLKNKAYIIIEIGSGEWKIPHSDQAIKGSNGNEDRYSRGHNYFIEMVKGRKPRFLHFGYGLRGFKGKGPGGHWAGAGKPLLKVRQLGDEFPVPVDELLSKEFLHIQVRNHMGDIIITFEGVPQPWRITRRDYIRDNNNEVIEKRIPMVVSHGPLKIHGGNMTVGIMYGPLIYEPTGWVVFRDRQADVGEITAKDIYATFARPGDNDLDQAVPRIKRAGFFRDPQFQNMKMGYDVDAYEVTEIHKNQPVQIKPYEIFTDNYRKFGKEWACRGGLVKKDFYQAKYYSETPSRLEIIVVSNYNALTIGNEVFNNFNLNGLPLEYMGEDGQYIGVWDVAVYFDAGSMALPGAILHDPTLDSSEVSIKDTKGNLIGNGENYVLFNCVTPIATAWSLIVLGGSKVVTKDMTEDISMFVESISDGWSAEEYTSINHEAKLQLYLPISTGNAQGDEKVARILSLIDKTFFVTIAYWLQGGMGLDESIQTSRSSRSNDYNPYDNPRLIQMTGIAYGAEVERSVNKVKMTIDVKDYMEPLKQAFVFNCPFFDSVSDSNAVYEIVKMAGFDGSLVNNNSIPGQQNSKGIDRRPLGFLQELLKTRVRGLKDPVIWNEERHIHDYFALPGAYADINEPVMKFANGTPYKEIIDKLVKLYGKTVYFDRYGVLIVEISPAKLTAFSRARNSETDPDSPLFDVDVTKLIKAAFTTSPRLKIWDVEEEEFVTFNARKHTPFLAYNVAKIKRDVASAINHINMFSATAPDSDRIGFIVKGRTFYDQIWDPQAEGFFGYRKAQYNADGIYGNDQSTNSAMTQYARMKYPIFQVSFETYGIPGLKPLDIIMIDGQPLYITEINHDLEMKSNTWWMTISGEWIKSFDDKLLLPKMSEIDIGEVTA